MEREGTLFRAAVRRLQGTLRHPGDQKQAEAITISSPEEGRAVDSPRGFCKIEPERRATSQKLSWRGRGIVRTTE